MKGWFRKIFKISSMKYIVAFLIPMIFVLLYNQGLDNDSWYVLAEGRQIVENGVYYTDALSMHDGLSVVVQNYGFAAIFYLIFGVIGAPGIYALMLVLNFVICYLIYKICMLISNKNANLSLLIMAMTDVLLALGFVTTRAQMVSFVIFLVLIYVLELYIKTNKTKYLWWLPILSFVQVNLHASLWWALILVLGAYIVDSLKKPRLHLQGYRTKPLLVVGFLMMLTGLINPYGVKMIMFIFTSYGGAEFHDLVIELNSFSPISSVFESLVYISIVGVLFLYIFGKKRNIRIRYLLMFFGFLTLGLNTIKGLSQFILVAFFPIALLYKHVRLEKLLEYKPGRNAFMVWAGGLALILFVVICPLVVSRIESYPSKGMVNAMDVIEADAQKSGGEQRVYTGYDDGGYVEYRGYKAYLDPRGEVFLKSNNKKADILYEWRDFIRGKIETNDFLKKYGFDYLLISDKDDPLYDLGGKKYEMIFKDDKEGIEVFKRI